MMKECTISTHNGPRVAQDHNRRNPKVVSKESHIRVGDGASFEIIYDKKVRKLYHSLFDDALKKYNAKQTRDDRKIKNYYDHIKNDDQKHTMYEMVVGVYIKTETNPKLEKEILNEFRQTWHKRNPNMILVGMYLHNDEEGTSPHLHIDYIPISRMNKRGLEVKNSLNLACEEMGFKVSQKKRKMKDGNSIDVKKTPVEQWIRANNDYLEKLCVEHGITVKHPARELAEKEGIRTYHLSTREYKRKMEEKEQQQLKDIEDNKNKLNTLNHTIEEKKEIIGILNNGIVKDQKIIEEQKKTLKNHFLTPQEQEILDYFKTKFPNKYKDAINFIEDKHKEFLEEENDDELEVEHK